MNIPRSHRHKSHCSDTDSTNTRQCLSRRLGLKKHKKKEEKIQGYLSMEKEIEVVPSIKIGMVNKILCFLLEEVLLHDKAK